MTKRKQKYAVSAAGLAEYIIGLLEKDSPLSVIQIATLTGYNKGTCRDRLEELELNGRVHRERQSRLAGWTYLYRLGPSSTGRYVVREAGVGTPSQRTVRNYPPINRRDPLVAFLFGPAGVAAAVTAEP